MSQTNYNKFTDLHINTSHPKKIIVVGDFMLDKYIMGSCERISREAPIPVVKFRQEIVRLGGAGNVVANLHGLGFEVLPFGLVGKDVNGQRIRNLLTEINCDDRTILEIESYTSTVKTRIVSRFQQIARIDTENMQIDEKIIINRIWPEIEKAFNEEAVSACIISDYDKGVCNPMLIEYIINQAKICGLPVLVDPRKDNINVYKGATYFVPNLREFSRWVPYSEYDNGSLLNMAQNIKKNLEIDNILITRGANGMSLITENSDIIHLAAENKDVFDVSGAGDTVISVLAAGIIWGLSFEEASRLSNFAAGIVVGKFGTSPIQIGELKQVFDQQHHSQKIVTLEQLAILLSYWRALEKRIVFTNGCFDLLHVGHITLLRQAKSLGDVLIVGLNTDPSVARLKGLGRPINSELERATLLAELEAVNVVVLFGADTPIKLIETIKPDIFVKGSDYVDKEIAEEKIVERNGGEVYLIPLVEGYSTSNLIRKIKGE